mmetsp:Transcript_3273/g.9059  ORF Transcript_3273/g.9059 Transcript_3273/m.9059 type:complete len:482 (+) Transcript_3273:171-1616(+)|eukprot:CAMPEP_0172360164 /NCGR_PEP_ID=MMETSP1060-20121228/4237_1 /TAXON_ID=37318 /ORGANISM="Pseudo-nitzschia pungens, Strain cf. cingulata" /LENGTH=481 /DNA_ID=CAMNT_0013082079 /DNA_START=146 /DNA_END=1591 /DNA_ORIENTATION=-
MSSKKISSPLLSIFQQWTAQQRKQDVVAVAGATIPTTTNNNNNNNTLPSHSSASSYRILLQTSYSLRDRIDAAEPVENPHLYKHAGVATPAERATRDIYGGAETAWLLRLLELAVQQQQQEQQQQQQQQHAVSDNESVSIVYVATKDRPGVPSIIEELPPESRDKVQVVDLASRDPFGWDDDEHKTETENNDETDDDETDDDGTGTTTARANLMNLANVYVALREKFVAAGASGTRKPVVVVWQSLTPLIVVHGFPIVLRLLCALPPCLQVWPIHTQILTPEQHARLEDASNALMCLRGGQMNLVRQGIREKGNILRQKLPFRLVVDVASDVAGGGRRRFRIAEEAEDDGDDGNAAGSRNANKTTNNDNDNDNDGPHTSSNARGKGTKPGERPISATQAEASGALRSSRGSGGRSRGIQLRIDDTDGGRSDQTGPKASSSQQQQQEQNEATAPNRPRIYLQDDDPEFDDFDEEDPDDDLEI